MNLVVGASGMVGSEVCCRLAGQGKPVRALVRTSTDSSKLKKLKSAGVNLVYGDLKQRSALDAPCRGVTTVISTASSTFSRQAGDSIESVDSQGQLDLVAAAKRAGVSHFIFVSFPPIAEDFGLQRAKRAVEQRLMESGISYTTLQPTVFMEVWLSPESVLTR